MRLRRFTNFVTGWRSLIIASILASNIAAKENDGPVPSIKRNDFDNQPMNVEYFDDSDVILFQDWAQNVIYRSENAGEKWSMVENISYHNAWSMYMHPWDNKRAYVLTLESTHYKTEDRGQTWQEFFTDTSPSMLMPQPLSFNAGDPDRIIFNGQDCSSFWCEEVAIYSTDGFRTDAKVLRSKTAGCYWAKSTDLFTTGEKDRDDNRILCIAEAEHSSSPFNFRLLISDNYFVSNGGDDGAFEPDLEPGRTVSGMVGMDVVKKYLVAAATAPNTDEMALYVTDDTLKWHRAEFPHDHKLTEKAYTILESTNYSIQVDVLTDSRPGYPMGVLLSSNSNGTYFTRNIEHTNRNRNGYVDFEKMAGVQGIIFVNTVANWREVQDNKSTKREIISWISFDDGRTWENLTTEEGDHLHLHSVTDMTNTGRVLSSPAPGLVMGIGGTGKHLKKYENGDLYVSDNAGLTWWRALSGPHKYEFGDQGSILVAIAEGPTNSISYSLDHGRNWDRVALGIENLVAQELTTTLDSTSLKFLLIGKQTDGDKVKYWTVSIDFDGMHERKCTEQDLEKWYARVNSDNEPTCLMGHKQYYMRRKKDAKCFMMDEFKDPEVQNEPCSCTDADFECDFNFVSDGDKNCVKKGPLVIPDGGCKAFDDETTFLGSSGWRLIPGNDCERLDGIQKDDLKDTKCSEAVGPPRNGKVSHIQKPFAAEEFGQKIYLERTEASAGEDESIIAGTTKGSQGRIWLSQDHGKTWDEIEELKDVDVIYIIQHPYFNDVVYFICDSLEVYYSVDRGNNIRRFGADAPSYPSGDYRPIMSFHPDHKDWIIWVGVEDKSCMRSRSGGDCHAKASWTDDRGDHWKTLKRYVRKCEFIPKVIGQRPDNELIYCHAKERESASDDNNPWQLISSNDFFKSTTKHFDDIIDFATSSEFIVVATKDKETNMKAEASIDGINFAEALFPPDFKVPHQNGYTVMDSSTHSVFLLVTTEPNRDYKYGTLIKSNSNGTSYVVSLSAINQDASGYVDFEKTMGIEGVALANIVANSESAVQDGVKRLKTRVTHNDGADWDFLPPPEKDLDGNSFDCGAASDSCSLHIHGYTERAVKSHTYSSPTAIGLMLGIGNVGEYLKSRSEADTFVSRDAGITWRQAMKGAHMWEFGDQGSIIVLVKEAEQTNAVHYSCDEGLTWTEYPFSDDPMLITEITTLPSDNSRNFILWAKTTDGLATINLDFTGLTDRQCTLSEIDDGHGDYDLWIPSHPKLENNCLFGHVSQYHRKKLEADCYNGRVIKRLHDIKNNCPCVRRDFECDFNYFRQSEGTCSLVPGTTPLSHIEECAANPDQTEYYDVSGYRRIPLTTCEGGMDMDKIGEPHACPGKEKEFDSRHGIGWVGLSFAILIPIIVAISAGWWVWRNWEGKFGQIRLGESSTFDEEAPYIKYPVMVISAIVAVIITLPAVASGAWNAVTGLFGRGRTARFTTRSSFARGANYAPVDEDEGELLGEDSDDEV